MRTLMIAVFVLVFPLTQAGQPAAQDTAAAPVGNAEAGKAVWALGNTSCRNCHGGDGEGAFGPTLAGRNLTYERFHNYVRRPIGRMPAYVPSELTDQEIADLVAYFNTLPAGAKPSEWRTPLPADASMGQRLAVSTVGCGQCHGATLETPRHGAAEVTGDWEWFKHMVYDHTTAQREQWAMLDPALPRTTPSPAGPPGRDRVRMGNYNTRQLPEARLREIYDWMIDLGRLAPLSARIVPGDGGMYTVELTNAGVRDKGITVEGVMVSLELPAGAQVVSGTGPGYAVRREGGESVATWTIPSIAAAQQEKLTITLASPVPTLRGEVRWARPAVKADAEVTFAMGGRGRGGA